MTEIAHPAARSIGNYTPIFDDLRQHQPTTPRIVGHPFHRIAVWHEGPGDERLGWNDQTRPLADFECAHGRLRTDTSDDCGCFTVAVYDREPFPMIADELADVPVPDSRYGGPLDPADTLPPHRIATPRWPATRPADRIADPPAERMDAMSLYYDDELPGGFQDADIEMIELEEAANERHHEQPDPRPTEPTSAPDAHLEAAYEDAQNGGIDID